MSASTAQSLIEITRAKGQPRRMLENAEIVGFIRDSFRSVWSLELLLLLKSEPKRSWAQPELVEQLRSSELVVQQSVESLVAGGLLLPEGDGEVRYAPASADIARLVDATQRLYQRKPDAVRRLIVSSSLDQLTAFADAFRLRKD